MNIHLFVVPRGPWAFEPTIPGAIVGHLRHMPTGGELAVMGGPHE